MSAAFIHPLAHVDATVIIGGGSKVWQFASITRGTVLGIDCSVSPHAMLDGSIYGDRVIISAGFSAGAGFLVGSDVFIAPSVTFCNDMWPSSDKDGYEDAILRGGEQFAVIVGDGATIGANAVILPGVRVGRGSIVAAGAVVDRDLPDGFLWRRNGYLSPVPADRSRMRMRWVA